MKRLILLGVVLCLLLTSCVEKPPLSSEQEYNHAAEITSAETEGIKASSDSETEPAKTLKELHPELHTLSYTGGDYIETEDAIYYNDRFRNRIYFSTDNGSHFFPLCSKANCSHSTKDCNAYGNGVMYFEDNLYTTRFNDEKNDFEVVKISLDGTDQGVVRTIPFPGGGRFQYFYHNGRVFLYYAPSANKPLDELETRLFMVDLSSGKLTEPIRECLKDGLRLFSFRFYQNILAVSSNGTYILNGPEQTRVLYIDLDTGDVKEYMQQYETIVAYIDDTKSYFIVNKKQIFGTSSEHSEGFYEQDIQTGEMVQCLDTDDIMNVTYDEDYIYALSYDRDKDGMRHTLYIYTRDYKLVEQVEMENYEFLNYVSSERLFFSRSYDQGRLYRYMEKSDIGSGNMKIYDVNK